MKFRKLGPLEIGAGHNPMAPIFGFMVWRGDKPWNIEVVEFSFFHYNVVFRKATSGR